MTRCLVAAAAVALVAFVLYYQTLLPGLDFGDTGSFQLMAGSPVISSRDAYPLYFAIGDLVMAVTRTNGARALNLASALEAAIACGLVVPAAAALSGSVLAGVAAALLFAGSYTFWSQALIAEVYALHALFFALTLLLLLRWERQPTLSRLAMFFAAYAAGFGNHLSMILLAPGYTLFLLAGARGGWRDIVRGRVIALAAAAAAVGSLQYLWNLRALWLASTPPPTIVDALSRLWFDVTKTDWRQTTMVGFPSGMAAERLRMYGFDLLQQFGWAGPALAACGIVHLTRTAPRRAGLLVALYLANALFALTYNVGDSHVFFLPSHLVIALLASCGTALIGSFVRLPRAVAVLVLVVACSRIWRDYPALDRSADDRPSEVLAALTAGLDDRRDVLFASLNWQVENGLRYFTKYIEPDVLWTRAADVAIYAPALARDNLAIGRTIVATERARADLDAAYGPLFEWRDGDAAPRSLADVARQLPAGRSYVLCVLRPSGEFPLNKPELAAAVASLTGGQVHDLGSGEYAAIAGATREKPVLMVSADRPFRSSATIGGLRVEIRIESWLAFDTIRRMGFGQVIANRHHALIVERGVSLVALDDRGYPVDTVYSANIFAPQPRYVLRLLHLP